MAINRDYYYAQYHDVDALARKITRPTESVERRQRILRLYRGEYDPTAQGVVIL